MLTLGDAPVQLGRAAAVAAGFFLVFVCIFSKFVFPDVCFFSLSLPFIRFPAFS